ncbi:MAG: helix-turn-helix transcriptional regulator [Bacteroidetes bacterium]|nr:helix-turn-helix transcriptional regulator [Bacteroidota bacterium]
MNTDPHVSTIAIKGMLCNRCIDVIKDELQTLGYKAIDVSLGEALIEPTATFDNSLLERRLGVHGFSVLINRKVKLVTGVKNLVAEVYSGNFDFPDKFRFAQLVASRLGSYELVSDAFIAAENKSLEKYIIEFRISKAKELLLYAQHSLTEIGYRLNFSSVAHLSSQFKQVTGLTPSFFKNLKKDKERLQHYNTK